MNEICRSEREFNRRPLLRPFTPNPILGPNLCAFASLADVAKGGDGAKSALREFLFVFLPKRQPSLNEGYRGKQDKRHN